MSLKPLLARLSDEKHRASTQLELLFDLVVVIAIAMAADQLKEQILAGEVLFGVSQFLAAFFLIWWPWNQFSWFASGFDNDDAAYRINVMVMMLGLLIITASLPDFFEHQEMGMTFLGYCLMRLSFALLWWRAGHDNPEFRKAAKLRTAGLVVMQGWWALGVFIVPSGSIPFYLVYAGGIMGELLIPRLVDKNFSLNWHREHIIERFGLLNIIVLGELMLSSAEAFEAIHSDAHIVKLILLGIGGMTITCVLWWLYFLEEEHLSSDESEVAFAWGYGHFLLYVAGAAIGSGLGVMLHWLTEGAHHVHAYASMVVSLPVGLYVVALWLVRDRYILARQHSWRLLLVAVACAAAGFLPPEICLVTVCVLLIVGLLYRTLPACTKAVQADEGV